MRFELGFFENLISSQKIRESIALTIAMSYDLSEGD